MSFLYAFRGKTEECAKNYIVPEPMKATLTVNRAQLEVKDEEGEEPENSVVVIESEQGIAPEISLIAKDVTLTEHGVVADKKETVKQVYEISLLKGEEPIMLRDEIIIKLLIAPNLRSESNLRVYSIDGDGTQVNMNAERVGYYLVFKTSGLDKFAIVGAADNTDSTVVLTITIILWILVLLCIIYIVIYLSRRRLKNKGDD